ncbi:MAG: hypothetical protein VW405_17590 [Rhodospirillaceae bacterium]
MPGRKTPCTRASPSATHNAHVEFLHIECPVEPIASFDALPAVPALVNAWKAEIVARTDRAKAPFDKLCAEGGLAIVNPDASPFEDGATYSWRLVAGHENPEMARRGRTVDLIVLSRADDADGGADSVTLEAALFDTGRPVLVAGQFAAANVMLLSVSIWAGAFSDMEPATRDLFHWISATIALPAVAFAGRPFFRSAIDALRHGRMNMDVPISLAVLLAAGISLHQTVLGREHAYFDASISLLFFLLVGRYLDHQARATATHLLGLNATGATVVDADGRHRLVPAQQVPPDTQVHVAAGARVPVDGIVIDGRSGVDTSLVTGETLPAAAEPGVRLYAGTLNLDAPLQMRTTAAGEDTLLA